MGACEFYVVGKGKTAREAFNSAVAQAQYEDGHGGYTGTIAEKSSFTKIEVPGVERPSLDEARKYASKLVDDRDRRIDDKWGPAGCIEMPDGQFLFFGWASS